MKSIIIVVALSYTAVACGGSPSDMSATLTDPASDAGPTDDAAPDTTPVTDDATPTTIDARNDSGQGPSAKDGGATEAPDSGMAVDSSAVEVWDSGALTDSGAPIGITNDAGRPLCCSQLPQYNAEGNAVGTLTPQTCVYNLASHPLSTSDAIGSVYCEVYNAQIGGSVCEQLDDVQGNVRGTEGMLEVCP